MERQCKNCDFYAPDKNFDNMPYKYGECHAGLIDINGIWPKVWEGSWCGYFRRPRKPIEEVVKERFEKDLIAMGRDPIKWVDNLFSIVNEQADDKILWTINTGPLSQIISYHQKALRRLHEAIQNKTSEECAMDRLAQERIKKDILE